MKFTKLILLFALLALVAAKSERRYKKAKVVEDSESSEDAEVKYVVKAIERADRVAEKKGLDEDETKELEKKFAKAAIKRYQRKANARAHKSDSEKYAWLKQVVRDMEGNINKKGDNNASTTLPFATQKIQDPLLKSMQADEKKEQTKTRTMQQIKNSYPIYKEDMSWSGWFWSFFGYPTRVQLDPTDRTTMYMLQNAKKEIIADPEYGLYVRVTDK